MQKCRFARVLFITDRDYALEGVDCARSPAIDSREAYSRFVIKELGHYIDTDFVLLVQWDGFVVNADAWSDEFLDYDYIGAKWTFHTTGTRSATAASRLRSRRLLEALRDPHIEVQPLEDVAICRTFRPYLEATHAIRFAPEAVADRFSFEASYFASLPFGFHGLFNFWMFLPKDRARPLPRDGHAVDPRLGAMPAARKELRRARTARGGGHASCARSWPRIRCWRGPEPPGTCSKAAPGRPPWRGRGRNAPCPCGSGKRYKDCHGRLTPA